MINSAIRTIADLLNSDLRDRFGLNEDIVAVSNLLEQDGSVAPSVDNRIVVFLVNVERDMAAGQQGVDSGTARWVNVGFVPLQINVYLMFACNFTGKNYGESLKFLSHILQFFQRHPVWDQSNAPGLDERIERLCLDIVNLDVKDVSNLWGVISSRYVPSVLYKVRTFPFRGQAVRDRVPTVLEPTSAVR